MPVSCQQNTQPVRNGNKKSLSGTESVTLRSKVTITYMYTIDKVTCDLMRDLNTEGGSHLDESAIVRCVICLRIYPHFEFLLSYNWCDYGPL